jgi:hypothetical protein
MTCRRTFRILTYSQLSGIKVIRPKYSNLYIIMIQCTTYKNYYTFKASNDNTHKTKLIYVAKNYKHFQIWSTSEHLWL